MAKLQYFTLDKAQQALVYIRPILLEIQIAYRTFQELESGVQERETLSVSQRDIFVARLNALREKVDGLLAEIEATGAEVKDLEAGLCDFAFRRRNGEVVLLCYRLGETAIAHWHGIDEGYANRRPIEELVELERDAIVADQ